MDNEKNLWLAENLQRSALETFFLIMDLNERIDMRLCYSKLSELMSLRNFTVDSLMNIPIRLERKAAERVVEQTLYHAAEQVYKASFNDAKSLPHISSMDVSRRLNLILTAVPSSYSLMRKTMKSFDSLMSDRQR